MHEDSVDCAAAEGITVGFPDGTFRPALPVPRDQMASFVARVLEAAGVGLPAASDQGFTDVAGNVHETNIDRLAAAGIVEGFPDQSFRPGQPVFRDQVASFVLRAVAFAEGRDLAALQGGGSPFTDIAGNVHQPNIEGAFNEELVRGTTESTFTPRAETRRDQMTTLLVRALRRLQTTAPERSLSLDVGPDPQETGEEVRAVATVTDGGGEPLENVTVSFTGSGDGDAVPVPDSNAEETTAAGQADYEFLSNTAGTVTVEACAPAVDGEVCDTDTVSFN